MLDLIARRVQASLSNSLLHQSWPLLASPISPQLLPWCLMPLVTLPAPLRTSEDDSSAAGAAAISRLTPTSVIIIAHRYPASKGNDGLVSLAIMLYSAFQMVSGCSSFLNKHGPATHVMGQNVCTPLQHYPHRKILQVSSLRGVSNSSVWYLGSYVVPQSSQKFNCLSWCDLNGFPDEIQSQ